MRKANHKLMASLAREAEGLSDVSAAKGIRTVNKIWMAAFERSRKIRTTIPELLKSLPHEDVGEAVR